VLLRSFQFSRAVRDRVIEDVLRHLLAPEAVAAAPYSYWQRQISASSASSRAIGAGADSIASLVSAYHSRKRCRSCRDRIHRHEGIVLRMMISDVRF
jgi:hypothetical protein